MSILTTQIKTPNAKELAIGVSLQCGLVTDTTVKSVGGNQDTSAAQGRIKVRVKITQPNGVVTYAEPDNGADLSGTLLEPGPGITYCDRYQKLAASSPVCAARPTRPPATSRARIRRNCSAF